MNTAVLGAQWLGHKATTRARGYLHCRPGSHVIQDVCADVNHLEQVGEELLHHGHQAPVTQSGPHLLLLGGCWAGLLFRGPWASQRLGGTGCDRGTHVTSHLDSGGSRNRSGNMRPSDPYTLDVT